MKKLLLALLSAGALSLLFFATPAEAARCPKNCVSWFDGCNTCGCKNGRTTFCTRKFCKRKARPRCLKYAKPTLTCRNLRCRAPRRCRMVSGKPRCYCPPVRRIRCKPGYSLAFKSVGGCRVAYCKKRTLSCKNVRCPKFRYCQMYRGKPRCVCRKVAIRCQRGYTVAYRSISGCRVPYCKKQLSCKTVRCPKYRSCKMIGGKPLCVCTKLAIRCQRGYTVAYKTINRCRIPYCKKSTLSCKTVRCPKYRYCKVLGGKPRCLCRRVAIRCAPGYTVAYKRVSGCRVPYCKKRPTVKACPRGCKVWYDGCNTCMCRNGRIAGCTKRYCVRKGRAYCKKR